MRKIRIKNFRSLVMEEPIEIRPLTLLFGKNGSGKSSFIKALRFLGQNLTKKALQKTVYQISDEVFLGNFKEIVNNKDINKEIEFEIGESFFSQRDTINYKLTAKFCDNDENRNLEGLVITDLINDTSFTILLNKINESVVENLPKSKHGGRSIEEIEEEQENADHLGFTIPGLEVYYDHSPSINFYRELSHPDERVKILFEQTDVLPFYDDYPRIKHSLYFQHLRDKSTPPEELIDQVIKAYYKNIPRCIFHFLNSFYISQIRQRPDYFYELDEFGQFSLEDYYGLLRELDDRQRRLESEKYDLYTETHESVEDFMRRKLKELELGRGIKINKDKNMGSICLIDNNRVEVNLAEASSGVIQILPILFESYFNYEDHFKGSPLNYQGMELSEGYPVMLLEQPELHLHPELQTRFIKFLTNSWSNFIIETHSEHIIRKIQVLIAQGKLKREKVAVYYFDKNENTGITSIEEMKLDDNGLFLKDWPKGFFDERVNLTLDLLEAIKDKSN